MRWRAPLLLVVLVIVPTLSCDASQLGPTFTESSYWNTKATDAPVDGHSDEILAALERENSPDWVQLTGTDDGESGFGEPIYVAEPTDPVFDVQATPGKGCVRDKPQFASVEIPATAHVSSSSDAAMTVYNPSGAGVNDGAALVFHLSKTEIVYRSGRIVSITACNDAVFYMKSDGLDNRAERSRCTNEYFPFDGCEGHRGFAPPSMAIRFDEIVSREIDHVLKLSVDRTGGSGCGLANHYFPMVNDEGGNGACAPEGARLRLKMSVDCDALYRGSPGPRTICHSWQDYGLVIGDQSREQANVKVEYCSVEKSCDWTGILETDSMSALKLDSDHWQVVRLGWRG
jgi:hypothetical protein